MNLDRLRGLVEAQLDRTRRARVGLAAGALAGVSLSGWLAFTAPLVLLRIGEGLTALGFVLMLALSWRRLAVAGPNTAETSVVFLREALVRRRNAARGGWVGVITPLLPGLAVTVAALVIASGGDWKKPAPIVVLSTAWLVAALVLQAREAAKVTAEIAELDRLSAA